MHGRVDWRLFESSVRIVVNPAVRHATQALSHHAIHLAVHLQPTGETLDPWIESPTSTNGRQVGKGCAASGQPQPVFVVEDELQAFVKHPELSHDPATKKHRGLAEKARLFEAPYVERLRGVGPEHRTDLIDASCLTV